MKRHELEAEFLAARRKLNALHAALVEPTRAAVRLMLESEALERAAHPLALLLYQIDTAEREMRDLFNADPKLSLEVLLPLMREEKRR